MGEVNHSDCSSQTTGVLCSLMVSSGSSGRGKLSYPRERRSEETSISSLTERRQSLPKFDSRGGRQLGSSRSEHCLYWDCQSLPKHPKQFAGLSDDSSMRVTFINHGSMHS